MLVTSALLAAAISVIAALLILWSNPARNVNRAIFSCTLHLAAWLFCLHLAFVLVPGLPWVRLASAVGTWLPMHFWIVKQTIVIPPGEYGRGWLRRHWAWIALCSLLAGVCFTTWFVPAHSTGTNRIYGWGYYGYIAVNLGLYAFLLRDAWVGTRKLSGVRRLELQVWLLGGCSTAAGILALMSLSALTHDRSYVRLQPLVVLLFYGATAYAITTHRILNARQLLMVAGSRLMLVMVASAVAFLLDRALSAVFSDVVALLITTGAVLLLAAELNTWLQQTLRLYPQAGAARLAAFEIARREMEIARLLPAFSRLIKGWGQTERTLLAFGEKDLLSGDGEAIADGAAVRALRALRWATPERLARERNSPDRAELARLLEERRLGVAVIAEGPTLTAIVGAGVPVSRRPFTYPQVSHLVELAAIMQAAIERAHFSVKAQRAEQLATVGLMGAGLAHEIRNPLVTIKTFVQLLPKHYDDRAFREKFTGLIGDEVTRIDHLTEQLLDLASPRAYSPQNIELHAVLQSGLELVSGKARDRRVELRRELDAAPDRVLSDAAAVKQVLLNLCLNAIQAIPSDAAERWVRVATRRVERGIELVVEDSGPGIPAEIRARLFQPFQSTKSSGFGLGLAVCSDIVARLDATIVADPAQPGRGATFRVVLPCPAS
ncbi:sensor histidine kinase [Opitutus terrae]|uniref:histidine kinase n=1 Tax=Opitutus terrae (strain DSM 11246 / JCM 15787 / PB90-1) TaxID=452637 RepID=B1ZS90_OPITP|nr:ATP-binding protein [Opitutus terrae]ACB75689.1 integral membrane sensor signal transduction histidine kinase [Opitutus terrae PB90-1]